MIRSLPLRVAPVAGEAIDSWLEAIADRYSIRLSEVLQAVGLQQPLQRRDQALWIVALTGSESASVSTTTGLHPAALRSMTLSHYCGVLEVDTATRTVLRSSAAGWRATLRSRFCPQCLRATGGRWKLAWRLGWIFACLDHRTLLAETCPHCGKAQRRLIMPGQCIPAPGRCSSPDPEQQGRGRATGRCGYDLTATDVRGFPPGHPVLHAQRILIELLTDGGASFGIYAQHPRSAGAVLRDLGDLAVLVLSCRDQTGFRTHLPADLYAAYVEDGDFPAIRANPHRALTRDRRPKSPLTEAISAVIALQILRSGDAHAAADAMRWLLTTSGGRTLRTSPRIVVGERPAITRELGTVALMSFQPLLGALEQLRYRHVPPRSSGASTRKLARRIDSLPTELWPAWALRIAPHDVAQYLMPEVLSCAALMVDLDVSPGDATRCLQSNVEPGTVWHTLHILSRQPCWPGQREALTVLSAYLDRHPAPIDYSRRRGLNYSDLLTYDRWVRICRETRTQLGEAAKYFAARALLLGRLSGRRCDGRETDTDKPGGRRINQLALTLTPQLAASLEAEARRFLSQRAITEPIDWGPPLTLLSQIDLAGPDPARIDLQALHQLANNPQLSLAAMARQLGTNTHFVEHLLLQHPVPQQPISQIRSRRSRVSAQLGSELTPQSLTRLRYHERKSLTAIAARFDTTAGTVARIAAAQGVSLMRVQIDDVPGLLRPALETQYGWQRLERYVVAAAHPSITAAASALHLTHSGLGAQIATLERDFGERLLNRATGGRPMTMTAFGYDVKTTADHWLATRGA